MSREDNDMDALLDQHLSQRDVLTLDEYRIPITNSNAEIRMHILVSAQRDINGKTEINDLQIISYSNCLRTVYNEIDADFYQFLMSFALDHVSGLEDSEFKR